MIRVAVVAFALLLAVAVHEGAHAWALRSLGYRVTEAGLGLPLPPTLRIRLRPQLVGTLSPWLVGAYVKAHDDDQAKLDALPHRDSSWYLNAGVVANFALAFAVWAVAAVMDASPLAFLLFAVLTCLVAWGRRWIAAYLLPVLAVPALAFMGYALYASWAAGKSGVGFSGMPSLVPPDTAGLVWFVGTVSFVVGLANVLPIYPLDNGKVIDRIAARWWGTRGAAVFKVTGSILVLTSIFASLGSDLWAMLT